MNDPDLLLPPHSVENEQAVLGILLRASVAMDQMDGLSEADFYNQNHRAIWCVITGLLDAGKPIDVISVAEALADGLDGVGGLQYLVSLASNAPATVNARHYAGVIRDRSMLRKLVSASVQIGDLAYRPGAKADETLAEAQHLIMELDTAATAQESKSLRDAMREMIEQVDAAYHGTVKTISTGFADLDEKIVGLEPGQLVIVAGRPSMGKSAIAMQIAEHVSETFTVAVFSLEMSSTDLSRRMAAGVAKLDMMKLRTGQLEGDEWNKLSYALAKLNERKIYIDDRSSLSVAQIRARARQIKRRHGLGLVVVDYIGLIDAPGENRATAIAAVTRGLKAMARELGVPVICLSQLNRQVTGRTDKRPLLSDLRESGAIEQDADLILLLHRDEYYNHDSQYKGMAECIIGKQRNGPTGIVPLAFMAEYARFGDLAGRYDPNEQVKVRRGFDV